MFNQTVHIIVQYFFFGILGYLFKWSRKSLFFYSLSINLQGLSWPVNFIKYNFKIVRPSRFLYSQGINVLCLKTIHLSSWLTGFQTYLKRTRECIFIFFVLYIVGLNFFVIFNALILMANFSCIIRLIWIMMAFDIYYYRFFVCGCFSII